MRIDILGNLCARFNGVSIVPSAPRPCQILALLALNSGRLVSKSTLLEELWGQSQPTNATTLHTYIHQLRRHIDVARSDGTGPTSRDILVTERNGYSWHLHGGETDVQEFRRVAAEGTAAFERGDFRAASDLLRRSLALWRSPALSELPIGPPLTLELLSLEDARIAALNRSIEADLRLGRHLEIMGELRTLALQEPLNENHAAHYSIALYHAGRVGDALAEYQRIRRALADELGVEPAARLQRLQRAFLSGDRVLEDVPLVGAGW